MKTRAQKWRSSLALRIPKALAKKAGLWPGAPVELSLVQGSLIIQRQSERVELGGRFLLDPRRDQLQAGGGSAWRGFAGQPLARDQADRGR